MITHLRQHLTTCASVVLVCHAVLKPPWEPSLNSLNPVDLLDPTTASGVVVYGLVAIAIAALGRWGRRLWVQPLRRLILSLPYVLRRPLMRLAYLLVPSWRSFSSATERQAHNLQDRINALSKRKRVPVCAVGGTYLDILFGPVDLHPPWDAERSTLQHVDISVGGSCYHLCKHLWDGFQIRTRLFTAIGQQDWASGILESELRRLHHVRPEMTMVPGARAGTSVHAQSVDLGSSPTYTYLGSVEQLRWGDVLVKMQKAFRGHVGILYLGGVLRTDLIGDMPDAIRQLSPGVLVVIDPGRTDPELGTEKYTQLARLLRLGCGDILIMSPTEMRLFLKANGLDVPEADDGAMLAAAADSELLPRVTIIRGQKASGYPKAALILDGRISLQQGDDSHWTPGAKIGGLQAFNAALIRELMRERSRLTLEDRLSAATRNALIYWSSQD